MRSLARLTVSAGLVCVLSLLLRSEVTYVEPPSVEEELSIEGVRIDGSLFLVYDLGNWSFGPRDGIPLHLVHRIRTDPSGHAWSEMMVTGLTGYVVPADRSQFRCLFPGGVEALFEALELGTTFVKVGPGILARRAADGRLEVMTPGGWRWAFENGLPVAGAKGNLLRLEVESQGAKITRLRALRLGSLLSELSADYDSLGGLKEVRFGSRVHRFKYSGPRHQLTEWVSIQDGKETKTRFDYEGELLRRVSQGEVVQRELQWEAVPGGLEADTEWPDPVRVSAVGKMHFSYDLNYKGYAMRAENLESKQVQERALNPRRGEITVVADGHTIRRVYFGVRRSRADAGKAIRVENGKRELVARYSYDAYGRVSSFWAGSEDDKSRLDFSYDQLGRRLKTVDARAPHANEAGRAEPTETISGNADAKAGEP